jgi:hypothetical protein
MISAAICCLAELPQCRPGLVSGGILKLLRMWIETGCRVLMDFRGRSLVEIENKLLDQQSVLIRLSEFMCNTSRAMMYIVGGFVDLMPDDDDDERDVSKPRGISGRSQSTILPINQRANYLRSTAGNNLQLVGYEYMIGRIDAEVLSEDLHAVIVRYITTMVVLFSQPNRSDNSFHQANKINDDSSENLSSSRSTVLQKIKQLLFPKLVAVHLAQSLYQLSSRMQNRPDLLSIGAPKSILALLQHTVCEIRSLGANRTEEEIKYDQILQDVINMSETKENLVVELTNQFSGHSLDIWPQQNSIIEATTNWNRCSTDSVKFVKIITSSCLDAISYFLIDATSNHYRQMQLGHNGSSNQPATIPSILAQMDEIDSIGLDLDPINTISSGNPLVDTLCSPSIVETMKVTFNLYVY